MPFTLFWELSPVPTQIAGAGSHEEVLRTLIETFGRNPRHPLSPVEFSKIHVMTLRSLAGSQGNSVFGSIADLIDKNGKIRVWGLD